MFRRQRSGTRIFFATDIHGSEPCFRKWLNAARVYEVDALVLGGDLTGKALVPVVSTNGHYTAEVFGKRRTCGNEQELDALRKQIRTLGHYDLMLTADQKAALDGDPDEVAARFRRRVLDSVRSWVALADERLAASGVPAYAILGNDDFPEIAEILRGGTRMRYAEDGICELPGGWELLSFGYSTPTPWHTPRELDESAMAERLDELAACLAHQRSAVFNIHCPPKDTHLDQAPALDAELRPIVGPGGVTMTSAGSQAVKDLIKRTRPILGLHGHVHESAGTQRLGDTLCVNPGSEYGEGILRGALLELDREHGVRRWQLVQA
jgi:Icc-related predicted phosphoesterase